MENTLKKKKPNKKASHEVNTFYSCAKPAINYFVLTLKAFLSKQLIRFSLTTPSNVKYFAILRSLIETVNH